MKNKFYIIFIAINLSAILFLISCSEDVTPSLYDMATESSPTPVISSLDPPNEALAGVTKITITGSNFSATSQNNLVYFNGLPGKLISATTTQLEVVSAVVISDSVSIKVAVIGSDNFSNIYTYKLKPAVAELFPFNPDFSQFPYASTVDNLENVYASLKDLGTKKIDPQSTLTDFAPKGPETFFRSMTYASDNAIYAVRGGVKGVYKVVANTAPAAFVASSQGITDNVNAIDFDQARNVLWAGGSTGIVYRITLTKNVKKFNIQGTINALRVAANYLYIASTTDKEVIWKMEIVSADSLGAPQLYLDFTAQVSDLQKVMDIVVAQDGDLYIGSDKTSDPIYVVHPDKSFEELYPGLITSSAYSLVWGKGNFVYLTTAAAGVNETILKIDMQKPGAH
jgi:hypothetical protein